MFAHSKTLIEAKYKCEKQEKVELENSMYSVFSLTRTQSGNSIKT